MDIFSIIGIAVVSAIICVLISQYKPEYSVAVSIMCGAIIFFMIISNLSPAFDTLKELMQKANINSSYTKAIIKTLGICYVTQLACDSCKDAGQTAIANKVELAGKIFILLISLPIFNDLVSIAFSLMNVKI